MSLWQRSLIFFIFLRIQFYGFTFFYNNRETVTFIFYIFCSIMEAFFTEPVQNLSKKVAYLILMLFV